MTEVLSYHPKWLTDTGELNTDQAYGIALTRQLEAIRRNGHETREWSGMLDGIRMGDIHLLLTGYLTYEQFADLYGHEAAPGVLSMRYRDVKEQLDKPACHWEWLALKSLIPGLE